MQSDLDSVYKSMAARQRLRRQALALADEEGLVGRRLQLPHRAVGRPAGAAAIAGIGATDGHRLRRPHHWTGAGGAGRLAVRRTPRRARRRPRRTGQPLTRGPEFYRGINLLIDIGTNGEVVPYAKPVFDLGSISLLRITEGRRDLGTFAC